MFKPQTLMGLRYGNSPGRDGMRLFVREKKEEHVNFHGRMPHANLDRD